MNTNLSLISAENINTIESTEIANMLELPHAELLKKLEGTKKLDGTIKQVGIIPILTKGNFPVSDYFIPSTYKDNSGKENKCYLFTRLGCDFIANKFTGEKGIIFTAKYVKKFQEMERYIKKQYNNIQIPFPDIVQSIQIIANDLKVNDASKIIMYTTLYKDYNLPTNFLPKYEFNGNRDMKPATELLKRFNLELSAKAFNNLMIANGYLEERTRNSRADITKVKKYKALTDKGLKYGENAVCVQCQKETQPLYYADTFEELFDIVSGRNELVV